MDRTKLPWWMTPWMGLPAFDGNDGPVSQNFSFFSPTMVKGEGDLKLEREIVTDVATYGKQLGELTDVVLALAAHTGLAMSPALDELTAIRDAIELKKTEYRKTTLERASKALAELKEHDPAGYKLLLNGLTASGSN